jgi:hypothetical protein
MFILLLLVLILLAMSGVLCFLHDLIKFESGLCRVAIYQFLTQDTCLLLHMLCTACASSVDAVLSDLTFEALMIN